MEIIISINGTPKEIAALVLETREQPVILDKEKIVGVIDKELGKRSDCRKF